MKCLTGTEHFREWSVDAAGDEADRSREGSRCYADHGDRPAVQLQRLAENRGVSSEARLPVAVVENDHRLAADVPFLGRIGATQARLQPQGGEVVPRGQDDHRTLRYAVEGHLCHLWRECGDVAEDRVESAIVAIVRKGDRTIERDLARAANDRNQLISFRDRQALPHDAMNDAEDGRRRRDTERQGEDRGG